MEHNIVPFPIPPHSSNQVQPLDLCVYGITKRLMTRLNELGEGNVQSLHIVRLVSAFHSADDPMNAIASFRNAWIARGPDQAGISVCHVDMADCRIENSNCDAGCRDAGRRWRASRSDR
jgi:hypothetical protein